MAKKLTVRRSVFATSRTKAGSSALSTAASSVKTCLGVASSLRRAPKFGKSYTSKLILTKIQTETESRRSWMIEVFYLAANKHKRNLKYQFWTHENHAIEVFSNRFIKQKVDYIHNNPVRAGIVNLPDEYIYSSARNYADKDGVLEVFVLNLGWRTV
jgi:hypothetical protein